MRPPFDNTKKVLSNVYIILRGNVFYSKISNKNKNAYRINFNQLVNTEKITTFSMKLIISL